MKKVKLDYTIPALGDFTLINHRIQPDNDQQIILQFSDPSRANARLLSL